MKRNRSRLQRTIGLPGAVLLGLGSILGTGVYVSLGLAAGAAGALLWLAILIAAALALCNGISSAQLAAAYPVSGGTYEYAYRTLNPELGFTAGWMFLCAKGASAATATIGIGGYLLSSVPGASHLATLIAGLAVLVGATVLAIIGMKASNRANAMIVAFAILGLLIFVVATLASTTSIDSKSDAATMGMAGLLHGAALVFVAFTGYGRIATLGEEVHHPRTTIPRSIFVALAAVTTIYILVGYAAVSTVGSGAFARLSAESAAPLVVIAREHSGTIAASLVFLGAVAALVAVLLNLVLGLSRVVLAMGRRRDFSPAMADIHPHYHTPWLATLAVFVGVALLASIGSVRMAWSFSALTVLVYYSITNMAALRLPSKSRTFPRFISWLGLGGCLALAIAIPPGYWAAGGVLLLAGFGVRRLGKRKTPEST